MAQMTIRTSDELLEQVRRSAEAEGRSMNEQVNRLLQAYVDPDSASDGTQRMRERLARAGVLADVGEPVARPDRDAVARARAKAARGTSTGADLVSEGRG